MLRDPKDTFSPHFFYLTLTRSPSNPYDLVGSIVNALLFLQHSTVHCYQEIIQVLLQFSFLTCHHMRAISSIITLSETLILFTPKIKLIDSFLGPLIYRYVLFYTRFHKCDTLHKTLCPKSEMKTSQKRMSLFQILVLLKPTLVS